jgi:hypothetical protein
VEAAEDAGLDPVLVQAVAGQVENLRGQCYHHCLGNFQ